MVNCATVQQSVEDDPGFLDALNDMQGDCGWNALVDLTLEVISGEGTVTGDALKTRVEKAWEGKPRTPLRHVPFSVAGAPQPARRSMIKGARKLGSSCRHQARRQGTYE